MPPRKRKDDSDSSEEEVEDIKKQKTDNGASPEVSEDDTEFTLPAPKVSGQLIISGGTNWDLISRRQLPKGMKDAGGRSLWGPHRLAAMNDKPVRSVISGCCSVHSVVIDTNGEAYTWGRNDKSQLGHGNTERRDVPTLVDCLSGLNVITAACGRNHTLFLTERGSVFGVGDNKMGQLGLGNQNPSVSSPAKYKGPPISKVGAGGEFSAVADIRGNLYTFGCPEYGQLGHNTDGQYFVTSNKTAYNCELKPRKMQVFIEKSREGHITPVIDVEIEQIACGANHAVALDKKKRIFTWGFGGYGRLGHTDQKDEWVPRLVKFFEGTNRGAVKIAAGSSFTMAISEIGALYLWGKNKPTGEAAMYPKPVNDLSGWDIRSIGCCNTSIVVAADESVVSWGSSPTNGELAYGDSAGKSSSTPQEAKPFGDIYVHAVACGYGHSLFIARNDTEEDKKHISKLPQYTPQTAKN